MKMKGAELVIKLLAQQGIRQVAGIPGGAALPLYDALLDSGINHVLARHEQGAGFIAQGTARVTGKPQVCLASSGPGATNLLTAVADANLDSIPLVVITAQVAQEFIGTDAFQEVDTFGLMLPITKHNFFVRSAAELMEIIPEAFAIASSGRPGPVSIDIPKDVQLEVIEVDKLPPLPSAPKNPGASSAEIESMASMLREAKRPVLMIGGGAVHSACHDALLRFAESQQLPVVCSFMGLGVVPSRHPLNLGMLGMHGARYTNLVMEECDLLIGAGVRFDDRATGDIREFCPTAKVIHIDIDAGELNKLKKAQLAIRADLGEVLNAFLERREQRERRTWLARVKELRRAFPLVGKESSDLFTPYGLLNFLGEVTASEAIIVTDVGQHQMWTAQVFPFSRPRQWLSSGGLGTMGFGLPAAIGAALAEPTRPVLCISGDGSILMNLQELDTLAEHQLNIKIVIMNNQSLGLVRQQQSLFYRQRFNALNNSRPLHLAAIAEAMGVKGIDLAHSADPLAALSQALAEPGPCLIDIAINENTMVFPMVPPGAANKDMISELER